MLFKNVVTFKNHFANVHIAFIHFLLNFSGFYIEKP